MRGVIRGRRRAATVAAAAVGILALAPAPAAQADTTQYRGAFRCADGRPLAGARVELWQQHVRWLPKVPPNIVLRNAARADANGAWSFRISGDETNWFLRLVLVGQDAEVHDFPWPWNWYAETLRSQNDQPVRDYGTQLVSGYQCGVWNGFSDAGREFREQTGRTPPQGVTTVLAGAITAGVPVTMYNAVWWPSGYPVYKSSGSSTAKHEFAHVFRHLFDGGFAHFLFDSTYYWYLRNHSATSCKKTNSGFAFNEGWAEFWAGEINGLCPDAATGLVERNVAAMLKNVQDSCRLTRGRMVQVLIDHDDIHSIDEYTRALNCTPPKPKRLGKRRPPKPIGALLAERRVLFRAGRRFVASLGRSVVRLRRDAAAATRLARRPPSCPKRPCAAELEVRLRPVLASGRLAQALALRRRFAFLADRAAITRLAALSLGNQGRRLEAARKAVVGEVAGIVVRTLGRARDLARRLRADRASLDILARARAAAARRSAAVLAGMAPIVLPVVRRVGPTPGSPEPPPPPPDSEPKPDLVVDRVYAASEESWMWVVDVRNAGYGAAPASQTGLTRFGADEALIDTPALAPGESATVKTACPYGSIAEATARADAAGAVDESDEGNNDGASQPPQGVGGRCRYP